MTRFKTTLFIAAAAFGATGALAQMAPQSTPQMTPQTTPPTTPQTMPPASATPPSATEPAPTTTAPASYTDADVDSFASAALAVQKIQQDAAVPDADKQTKMASAVSSSGLTPEKFNAIATASQSDPALMKRIQTAAAAKMQASGAATGSTDATGAADTDDGAADAGGSTDASGSATR